MINTRPLLNPAGQWTLTIMGIIFALLALIALGITMHQWLVIGCNACDFRAWVFGMTALAFIGGGLVALGNWQITVPPETKPAQ